MGYSGGLLPHIAYVTSRIPLFHSSQTLIAAVYSLPASVLTILPTDYVYTVYE